MSENSCTPSLTLIGKTKDGFEKHIPNIHTTEDDETLSYKNSDIFFCFCVNSFYKTLLNSKTILKYGILGSKHSV